MRNVEVEIPDALPDEIEGEGENIGKEEETKKEVVSITTGD